jgi:hypothetical protein
MRLYSAKIPTVANEIIRTLTQEGDIEVTDAGEAQLDVEAVLKEFLRQERELTDKTKDILESRGLPYDQFGKVKRALAEERGFGVGEEAVGWICNQVLETFMQSAHVDEIYAEDAIMRKKMRDLLRKHMQVDEALDEEVRRRIKNLQEGTATWEIEYQKVLEQLKRNRGIDE